MTKATFGQGSIPEDLDARLKQSTERIERLRAQLAAHLQQAEALLAEPVAG
jgi:hypothetical protein